MGDAGVHPADLFRGVTAIAGGAVRHGQVHVLIGQMHQDGACTRVRVLPQLFMWRETYAEHPDVFVIQLNLIVLGINGGRVELIGDEGCLARGTGLVW